MKMFIYLLLTLISIFGCNQAIIINIDCLKANNKDQTIVFLDDFHTEYFQKYKIEAQKLLAEFKNKSMHDLSNLEKFLDLAKKVNQHKIYQYNLYQANLLAKLIPENLINDCLLLCEDTFSCYENLNEFVKKNASVKLTKKDDSILEVYNKLKNLKKLNEKGLLDKLKIVIYKFRFDELTSRSSMLNIFHLICLKKNIHCKNLEFRMSALINNFEKLAKKYLINLKLEHKDFLDEKDLVEIDNLLEKKVADIEKLKAIEYKILHRKIKKEILNSNQKLIIIHAGHCHNTEVKNDLISAREFYKINNLEFDSLIPSDFKDLVKAMNAITQDSDKFAEYDFSKNSVPIKSKL